MSVVSLLNVITWVFIGLTTIIFCLCFIKYRLRFNKALKDIENFDINNTDSLQYPLKDILLTYRGLLINQKTSECANDVINFDSISKSYNIKTTVLSSIPNILTSIGILGTFVGLSIAIINFNAVSSDSIRDSIDVLLKGMGTAFYTSVVGMFTSSVFLGCEKNWINKLNWNIDSLCGELDRKYYISANQLIIDSFRYTTEDGFRVEPYELLVSMKESIKDMQNSLSRFSTDLVDSIGVAMDTSFQDKLVPILNDLSNKLENPAQVLTDSLMIEFRNICNDFRNNLTSGINEQMDELIERFIDASNAINNIPETLNTINMELTDSTDKAVNSYHAMSESLENHVKQFDDLSDTFAFSIERINEAFVSLSELNTQLQAIPEAINDARCGIDAASNNLREAIKNITESLEFSSKVNSNTGNMVDSYLNQISSIEGGLKTIIEELIFGLNKYSSTARDGLQSMLNPFTTSVTDAAQNITNTITPLHDSVGDLNDFSLTIHESIVSFTKVIESLDKSIKELKDIKDNIHQ